MWKEVGIFIFIHLTTHYFEVSTDKIFLAHLYESTERAIALLLALALALAAAAVSGLTNMLKFYVKVLMDLVFIWYNYRCWSKILLSPSRTPAQDHRLKNFMLKFCVKSF